MLSASGKAFLLNRLENKEEGYRQYCYDDETGQRVKAPKGLLTIGIGWNLDSVGCPIELARIITSYFIDNADSELSKTIDFYDRLDETRKIILVDMVFNMGAADVIQFKKTLASMRNGLYQDAANGMRDSLWYKRLPKRVEPLAKAMESGSF